MKTLILVVIALTLVMPAGLALAQDDAAKPWDAWEPPAVEVPDPNAWEIYQRAFALEEQIYQQLREEAGLPPGRDNGPVPAGLGPPPPPAPADGAPVVEQPVEVVAPPAEGPPNAALRLEMSEQSLEPETLARLIDAYTPVFSALEAAIAGQTQVPPIRSREDIEKAFPEFAHARQACRMFASRSVYDLQFDDPLSATLDGVSAMRVGNDVGTHGSLLGGLVQIACTAIGEVYLREAIPLLGADEALIAANALRAAMAEAPSFAQALTGEESLSRFLMREHFVNFEGMEEVIQTLRDDPDYARELLAQEEPAVAEMDEAALKALVEEKIAQLQALAPEQAWEELGSFYAAWQAEAAKPYWAREPVAAPDNLLLQQLTPSFERSGMKYAAIHARLRVDLAAIAAQAFHAEHGVYPASLDALVPDYLPEVPRDPFADAPLLSVAHDPVSRAHPAAGREPEGARVLTIYSVGPDGDDDHGVDIGRMWDKDTDGDVALTLGAE